MPRTEKKKAMEMDLVNLLKLRDKEPYCRGDNAWLIKTRKLWNWQLLLTVWNHLFGFLALEVYEHINALNIAIMSKHMPYVADGKTASMWTFCA